MFHVCNELTSSQVMDHTHTQWSHLIAGWASWFQQLSVVSSTVDLSILVEVDKVYQQLLTRGARKACWVPARPRTRPRCKDGHLSSTNALTTLWIKQHVLNDGSSVHTKHQGMSQLLWCLCPCVCVVLFCTCLSKTKQYNIVSSLQIVWFQKAHQSMSERTVISL